ncbi:MAG: hypothetical protein ABJ246_06015 [Paracoccaceae bacterium]
MDQKVKAFLVAPRLLCRNIVGKMLALSTEFTPTSGRLAQL